MALIMDGNMKNHKNNCIPNDCDELKDVRKLIVYGFGLIIYLPYASVTHFDITASELMYMYVLSISSQFLTQLQICFSKNLSYIFLQLNVVKILIWCSHPFLNQARAAKGRSRLVSQVKVAFVRTSVCVSVCLCVLSEGINNHWRDMV